jgi:hypothetical protein
VFLIFINKKSSFHFIKKEKTTKRNKPNLKGQTNQNKNKDLEVLYCQNKKVNVLSSILLISFIFLSFYSFFIFPLIFVFH